MSRSRSGSSNGLLTRPDGSAVRVMVVDDSPDLTEVLCSALAAQGFRVESAADGATAEAVAQNFRPDAVVLDVMLPDLDGLTVLGRIRAFLPDVCVLFLTARDAVEDRINGIAAGGDDYVTKPFSLAEVLTRLRGLLRRAGMARTRNEAALLTVGDLVLDKEAREVTRGGAPIHLTPTEFELLCFLMRHPRQVFSRNQLLEQVWNYDYGGRGHVVELYISYLRRKIDAGRPPMIRTVRGAGYALGPAAERRGAR
ncbi:response regulator transcription factor [Streptomyces sp. NPDC059743]|uniref:response regulator transcription factor n=1 Tax=Streptomyces sp. NPDC059743 TaxID=3346928 RepID=UPI0036620B54